MEEDGAKECSVCGDEYRVQGTVQSKKFVVSQMSDEATPSDLIEGEGIDGAANIGTRDDRVCFKLNDCRVEQTTVNYYIH